jgi:hypothetical protein
VAWCHGLAVAGGSGCLGSWARAVSRWPGGVAVAVAGWVWAAVAVAGWAWAAVAVAVAGCGSAAGAWGLGGGGRAVAAVPRWPAVGVCDLGGWEELPSWEPGRRWRVGADGTWEWASGVAADLLTVVCVT